MEEETIQIDEQDNNLTLEQLSEIIFSNNTTDELIERRGKLVPILARKYVELGRYVEIINLLPLLSHYFSLIPKSKTAKLVRLIVDEVTNNNENIPNQIEVVKSYIDWCKNEKRTFLRQRMDLRLAILLSKINKYTESLHLLQSLTYEIKKLEDKQLMVEVSLFESQLYYDMNNIPKSKSSLTAARAIATSIYISPSFQAEIDMQAGILYTMEGDYRTSYSYFLEAYETFDQLNSYKTRTALQYLLLTKILNHQGHEVPQLCQSKYALKYNGIMLEAMRELAICYNKRSLIDFKQVLVKYKNELMKDKIISNQMATFEDELINNNILKILEPYSCLEIEEIVRRIKLPYDEVENKLSLLILDHKINATLDRGNVFIFDRDDQDKTFDTVRNVINELPALLNSLQEKSSRLR